MKRLLLFIVAATCIATPAVAAPEDVANDISSEVVSPYCLGVTLHDCPSAAAVELRAKIQTWLEDGASRQAVLDRLESEYGTTIHAAPEAKGTGLLAYLLPIGAVLVGLALIVFVTRRWTRGKDDPPPPSPSSEDRNRLEAELAAYRSGS
jgi:cytochrome c-type biogenesis protein CcmH/NrfF